jgi:hypothetical protein
MTVYVLTEIRQGETPMVQQWAFDKMEKATEWAGRLWDSEQLSSNVFLTEGDIQAARERWCRALSSGRALPLGPSSLRLRALEVRP